MEPKYSSKAVEVATTTRLLLVRMYYKTSRDYANKLGLPQHANIYAAYCNYAN